MAWSIKFEKRASKAFCKLDPDTQRLIREYLDERVVLCRDPRELGKALRHDKSGLWRYRVDKYRIICQIRDEILLILVIEVGKRDSVYES